MISKWVLRALLAGVLLGATSPARAALGSIDTTGMDWSKIPEYRIVPSDILRFNFGPGPSGGTDVIREGRVRPDGRVSVFPVGEVVAAGRTVRELQTAVLQLMSAEFRLPRVSIEVFEVAGNRVHVMGRVRAPGSYPALPFMTVSQAVAAASGFEDDAARNSVIVFHRDGARTVKVERLKLDRSLKRASLEDDPVLTRFDIVFVPRSAIGNINIFTRQFFADNANVLQVGIAGWELFHLDRVFVVR